MLFTTDNFHFFINNKFCVLYRKCLQTNLKSVKFEAGNSGTGSQDRN